MRPTDLATVVAASGAFPGVFSPVMIDGLYYMDGGVFENLGLEGLHQFLIEAGPSSETPRLLVICDVSAPLGRPFGRPSMSSSALRAIDILHAARQWDLLQRYLRSPELPKTKAPTLDDVLRSMRELDGVPANRFWQFRDGSVSVVHLNLATMISLKDEEQAAIGHVRNLSTLTELSARDVDLAFWAGATLAVESLSQMCRAVGLYPCPQVAPPPLPH